MTSNVYVNVSGTWKQADNVYVNVSGTWKTASEVQARISSQWKGDTGGSGTTGLPTYLQIVGLDYVDFTLPTIGVITSKTSIDGFSLDNVDFTLPVIGITNASLIITNLVLHLDAGDSSSYSGSGTTWTDLSGNSNNATLTNGPTFDSDFGGVLVFDGTDDRADLTAGSDFAYGTGDFTIEIWFNVTGTSPQIYGERLFTQTVGGQNYFKVGVADGNPLVKQLYFKYGTGGGNRVRSGFEYTVNQWHHYIVTRNGTTVTQYVDGSLEQTTTGVSFDFDNTTYNPTIAAMTNSNNQNLDGKIAQVRVYKGKGFSASDVLNNYNATKNTYGYGTVSDPSGIIAAGLDILLDAGNSNSYSGSGTTWTNLAPSSSPFGNATLSSATGTNTYSSNNSGYFDECRAFIDIGSSITYPTMTYSVWCYPDSLSGYQTLVDQADDNWFFGFNGTALITYDPNATTGGGTVANNNWYNLTMTHTQNDVIKFYKNGIKIKETTSTSNRAPSFGKWCFGGGGVTTSNFNEGFRGYIATIAVYNRALSHFRITGAT